MKAPADLGEMLLKQGSDIQPFFIDGLFIDNQIFKGLLPLEQPKALSLKPSELYSVLRIIAKQRYGFELPERQQELKCLSNSINKLATIRDVCLKLGVKIAAGKEYALENEVQKEQKVV